MKVLKPLLLSLLLVVLLVAFSACGSEPASSAPEILYYVNADGETCTVFDIGSSITGTEIVIPEQIDGYTVTCIAGYAFSDKPWITSVTIPVSVTTFGNYLFNNGGTISIIYEGTVEQWRAIERDSLRWMGAYRSVVHCTDGDI